MKYFLYAFCSFLAFSSCKDENDDADDQAYVYFKFYFDSTQARLDNLGQASSIPAGNAAQSPRFNGMAAHYLEMINNPFTQVGEGVIVYQSPETTAGGSNAISFKDLAIVGQNQQFLKVPIKDIQEGTYTYLRVSLAYQNYEVDFKSNGFMLKGTLASFVGYNSYIESFTIKDSTVLVNDDKLQGYWAFEVNQNSLPFPIPVPVQKGQAPITTVVNPLAASSPIPAGSCLVTGEFTIPLIINHGSNEDITVLVSLSTNKSFEWEDTNGNNIWDAGEEVVDMGLRGMIPTVE